ncbi:MAG: hypothetical protein EOO81_05480 [Oxalobacteraceae bacterium]|jgi:hypothetical protein|nr:MAG: hypothetical protein EOO81_05480 [Oxalobacteraceae bacterium]
MRKYVSIYGDREKTLFVDRVAFDLPLAVSDAYLIICAQAELRRARRLSEPQMASAAYHVELAID